jgi:hypothetical protein
MLLCCVELRLSCRGRRRTSRWPAKRRTKKRQTETRHTFVPQLYSALVLIDRISLGRAASKIHGQPSSLLFSFHYAQQPVTFKCSPALLLFPTKPTGTREPIPNEREGVRVCVCEWPKPMVYKQKKLNNARSKVDASGQNQPRTANNNNNSQSRFSAARQGGFEKGRGKERRGRRKGSTTQKPARSSVPVCCTN